ncbi:hypothetical protein [Streptomyces sp. KL116D]|uniref:hypothetical protein n=1 Tax=Streptomyces sp. KL116D TaxID=3045152 RepID=UPI00355762BA
MQAHAEELRAFDTNVVSPDGYDAGQHSSAYDLALFARSGLQKKDFASTPPRPPPSSRSRRRGRPPAASRSRTPTASSPAHPASTPTKGIAGVKNGSNTTNAGATFTGVAERNNRVLLVTVMNPDTKESQVVYKETARLLDWGYQADGKVTPVGTLVPPKSATSADSCSGPAGAASPRATRARTSRPPTPAVATESSSGIGIAPSPAASSSSCRRGLRGPQEVAGPAGKS